MATVTPGYNWTSGETVTPAKLNSAAAPTVVVADNEITTAKILDDAVTNDKLSLAANAGEIKKALNADNSPPIYACRAWVNFDGTSGSTVDGEFRCTIRASGNVSKVVRNSTGNYTVSFTTAMPDANYATVASINKGDANADGFASSITGTSAAFQTASAASIVTAQGSIYPANVPQVSVAIFR